MSTEAPCDDCTKKAKAAARESARTIAAFDNELRLRKAECRWLRKQVAQMHAEIQRLKESM